MIIVKVDLFFVLVILMYRSVPNPLSYWMGASGPTTHSMQSRPAKTVTKLIIFELSSTHND